MRSISPRSQCGKQSDQNVITARRGAGTKPDQLQQGFDIAALSESRNNRLDPLVRNLTLPACRKTFEGSMDPLLQTRCHPPGVFGLAAVERGDPQRKNCRHVEMNLDLASRIVEDDRGRSRPDALGPPCVWHIGRSTARQRTRVGRCPRLDLNGPRVKRHIGGLECDQGCPVIDREPGVDTASKRRDHLPVRLAGAQCIGSMIADTDGMKYTMTGLRSHVASVNVRYVTFSPVWHGAVNPATTHRKRISPLQKRTSLPTERHHHPSRT